MWVRVLCSSFVNLCVSFTPSTSPCPVTPASFFLFFFLLQNHDVCKKAEKTKQNKNPKKPTSHWDVTQIVRCASGMVFTLNFGAVWLIRRSRLTWLSVSRSKHNFGLYHMLEACLALWDVWGQKFTCDFFSPLCCAEGLQSNYQTLCD